MASKPVPYEFVLEALEPIAPVTRPMFGAFAVYDQDKILFILRQKAGIQPDNGVWIATTLDSHESLSREFPNMRSIEVFGGGTTGWQVLPDDSADFEESALRACALVLNRDPRIGKIPKSKLPQKNKAKRKVAKSAASAKSPKKKAKPKLKSSKGKKTAKSKRST